MSNPKDDHEPPARGVRLAVLNSRIKSIASKMHNTLFRTARSGVSNAARDFSCCILTADARLVVVGESLPIHVMVGADMMARSMNEFHPVLKRGDAFLHNSPYHGCSHAADLSVLVPLIDDDGMHRFTLLAKAHQADIGNSIPTTYHATARDIYEEGALIFPAVKVQEDYRDIDDIIRMAQLRIRVPSQWWGDYLASLGAARIGETELSRLGAEIGWEQLSTHVDEWFDYSEQRMTGALRRLPGGEAKGTCTHDAFPGSAPEGIHIAASVEVDNHNGRLVVDLRNNPDCMPNGFNLSEACARSGALIGVFNSLDDPSVPPNEGSFRRVEVRLRENCAVGIPRYPASTSVATSNVADRLIGAVQMAIAKLGEGFGMAEIGGCQTAAQAVVSGVDSRHRTPFINQLIMGDTLGAASPFEDGWLVLISAGTAGLGLFDSIEMNELRHPLRVFRRCLLPDTEGAGKFRGAPSSLVEYGPVSCEIRAVYQSDGTANPPRGVRGGLPGGSAHNYKRELNGELIEVDGWADVLLVEGETITGISCGGGGYGSPTERDLKRVKADREAGILSAERAKKIYGVVFNASGAVNEKATVKLRTRMRRD